MTGKRTLATLLAALATLVAWTANAADAECSCVCDNGSPDWACTAPPVNPLLGGGTTTLPEMPESCRTMSCPEPSGGGLLGGGNGTGGETGGGETGGGETGGGDGGLLGGGNGTGGTGGTGSGAEDPVESPVAGYKCKRRSIYRPDLKKHKIYKVCRPLLSDAERAAVAARFKKMKEEWKEAKRRHKAHKKHRWASYRGRHHDDDD